MKTEILHTILFSISFLSLFGFAEFLYHVYKIRVEMTRKLVHIGTGLITLLFPFYLNNQWYILFLCISFSIILLLSLRYRFLPSINSIDRESVGSLAFPFAVYGCFLAYDFIGQNYIYYHLPILILAISDPIAALSGKRWPIGKFNFGKDSKTSMGSGLFFLSSLLLSFFFFFSAFQLLPTLILSMSIAFVSTCTEAISRKGYDNLTIPGSILLTLLFFHFYLQWI